MRDNSTGFINWQENGDMFKATIGDISQQHRKEGLPCTDWTKKGRSSNQHSDLLTGFNLQACCLSTTFLGSNICSCTVTPKHMCANKIPTAWLSRHLRSYLLALGVLTERWWDAWLLNVCVMLTLMSLQWHYLISYSWPEANACGD